ncbi:MAG TPA: hypothetical protein VFP84_14895 [Kofleriaceae bacterium]|nr:hypothetical protein [Kofleriaceae bacterium]
MAGCGGGDDPPGPDDGTPTEAVNGLAAGNPDGACAVSAEAQAEDVSAPTTVIGTGTPASCTGAAVVAAVAKGGVITFDCGSAPVTIVLTATARVFNDTGTKVVIDGGNKVALSGGNKIRILYQNACDPALRPTSADCNNQQTPALTVQNIAFVDGNATGLEKPGTEDGGGGAIYVRGGRFKVINARFFHNVCDPLGSDVGGGAIRVLDFPDKPIKSSVDRPVYIVHSTFGGAAGFGNVCANGGALSSIGTSYTVLNSLFTGNQAIGHGANDGQGGNGGAIYNDGNTYDLNVCGGKLTDNHANEGGSAIFYVSNDLTGGLAIDQSVIQHNPKGTFETMPGMFYKTKAGDPQISADSVIGP